MTSAPSAQRTNGACPPYIDDKKKGDKEVAKAASFNLSEPAIGKCNLIHLKISPNPGSDNIRHAVFAI
jgi:hypothetical protein